MAKVRVYEIANELNIQSKEVIKFLEEKNITGKVASSSIEDETIAMVRAKRLPLMRKAAPIQGYRIGSARMPLAGCALAQIIHGGLACLQALRILPVQSFRVTWRLKTAAAQCRWQCNILW